MGMITQIGVKNYMSLKHVTLKLGHMTCVVGESRCGKSAFIRALQAFACNERGDSFVTHGAGQTAVICVIEDSVVGWIKGADTRYEVNNTVYRKLAGSVPVEVSSIVGMDDVNLGDNYKFSPNFHGQFDVPFLQKSTGSYIAKILGEITNINLLFRATKEARKLCLDAKRLVEIRVKDRQSVSEILEGYVGLDDRVSKLSVLFENFVKAESELHVSANLDALFVDICKAHSDERQAQGFFNEALVACSNLSDVELLSKDLDSLYNLQEEYSIQVDLLADVEQCTSSYLQQTVVLDQFSGLSLICDDDFVELDKLEVFYNGIETASKEVDFFVVHDEAAGACEREQLTSLEQFRVENPICPLCEEPWRLKEIVS